MATVKQLVDDHLKLPFAAKGFADLDRPAVVIAESIGVGRESLEVKSEVPIAKSNSHAVRTCQSFEMR